MGINDLLKSLKNYIKDKHISEFKNKTAAIDILSWLYKGIYSCINELSEKKATTQYLNYIVKMLALLLTYDITPIAIFDGELLNAKKLVNEERAFNRTKYHFLGLEAKKNGNEEEALRYFRRGLSLKNYMIQNVIILLRKCKIKFIIAPYESDAQIAYLCRNGICNIAITEDSDLMPYGVNEILYKLNLDGKCSYINMNDLRKDKFIVDPDAKIIGILLIKAALIILTSLSSVFSLDAIIFHQLKNLELKVY